MSEVDAVVIFIFKPLYFSPQINCIPYRCNNAVTALDIAGNHLKPKTMRKILITEEIRVLIREWNAVPDHTYAYMADLCGVSVRTVLAWISGETTKILPHNYWPLLLVIERIDLWGDRPAIGITTIGEGYIRRSDGVLISEREQINIDRQLRGSDSNLRSPEERLIELELSMLTITHEIASINMAMRKNPPEQPLLFPPGSAL